MAFKRRHSVVCNDLRGKGPSTPRLVVSGRSESREFHIEVMASDREDVVRVLILLLTLKTRGFGDATLDGDVSIMTIEGKHCSLRNSERSLRDLEIETAKESGVGFRFKPLDETISNRQIVTELKKCLGTKFQPIGVPMNEHTRAFRARMKKVSKSSVIGQVATG